MLVTVFFNLSGENGSIGRGRHVFVPETDLRKLIYIDGDYWRINKISDYAPLTNKTTKVELVKWISYGGFVSDDPTLNQNDGKWNNSTGVFFRNI